MIGEGGYRETTLEPNRGERSVFFSDSALGVGVMGARGAAISQVISPAGIVIRRRRRP